MTLALLLPIAAGATIGGFIRFLLASLAQALAGVKIPGTFAANLLACLAAGVTWGLLRDAAPHSLPHFFAHSGEAFFITGLAGALSTWSTLAGEIVALARQRSRWCIAYPALTVLCGAICLLLGTYIPPNGV